MNQINPFAAILRLALLLLAIAMTAGCSDTPAEDAGKPEVLQAGLCGPHQIPVDDCFICDPALREASRLWCNEHERYEDRCFICHPELKEEGRLWCREHNLYEDECFICHPELKQKPDAGTTSSSAAGSNRPSASAVGDGLYCNEHAVFENECGICHPERAGELKAGQGLKIRFESAESADKAGVQTTTPVEGRALSEVAFLGQVTYNQNRFARITPLASGVVQRVLADVGNEVRAGQPLVEIASPEIAAAKSDFLTALADESLKGSIFQRKQRLMNEKIAARQDYELAESEYELAKTRSETARQQLLNYGFTEAQLSEIAQTRSAASTLPVRAPFSGTIVDRRAVIGEAVHPGDLLFAVAELSTMWLEISVPEDQISYIATGDPVAATFDALPGITLEGVITWLGAGLDDHTRMLKARAVLANPDALLKHGLYGQASIVPQRRQPGLLIPAESLHHFENKPFVFAQVADDLYEVRRVEVASRNGHSIEILAGLSAGDRVVSARSFTVKSEFLKARLGAGCVDD